MTVPKVALFGVNTYEPAELTAAIEHIFMLFKDQLCINTGDRILLKPNFIAPKPTSIAATTNPAVIIAVAKAMMDMGAKPFVADSPAWGDIFKCIEAFGCEEEFKKIGLEVKQLDTPVKTIIDGSKVNISKVALEADKIINIPKFKAHQQLGATFAIKNMYGCVCGKQKAIWHMIKGKDCDRFCRMIIEIYQTMNPALTIVDGITAMEGMGPLQGKPKHLGALIAGTDPVACERVCAELAGFDPENLPLLKMAEKMGLGCGNLDKIEIAGDNINNLKCKDFEHAQQTPLHFSFPRICKSLTKQLILMIKTSLRMRS